MEQNGSTIPVYTGPSLLESLNTWTVNRDKVIEDALRAKQALDILSAHGLIATPWMFWDGTGDLATYIINRNELDIINASRKG